jgi:hypothetical protein
LAHFLAQPDVPLFMPIVRLYMSMPISSVKPETVFSYAGELVQKKTARWDARSVEAHVLINDFTRQPGFSFERVLREVELMMDEHAAHEKAEAERKREAKRAQLQAELAEVDAEQEPSEEHIVDGEEEDGFSLSEL